MKKCALAVVLILLLCLSIKMSAQQKEFVVGAYMQSTPWERSEAPFYSLPDSALFSLWRAKALGINTAMVNVRQPDYDDNISYNGDQKYVMDSNMDNLEDFPNVIAMNTSSAYRLLDGPLQSPDTNWSIRNFDYIYFYSGAYYTKWDATKDIILVGELGLKHDENFGSRITYNGKEYWSSGLGHPEGLLVKGPNYNQETRYRSSTFPHPWANEIQTYKVFFDMILKNTPLPSQLDDPMCEIIVYTKYTTDNFVTTSYEKLASKILKVGEVGDPTNSTLFYDFSTYNQNAYKDQEQKLKFQPLPGSKELIDVEFRVKYLNPDHELLIDFIEVYDHNIWGNMLSTQQGQSQARFNIANYLQKFKQANSQFYANNLKYFFGVDEPHTVDAYIPHAFVQSVLDSLNDVWPDGAPQLFTHLYPEWNGYRNDARVIDPYVAIVKPKPFHFYYGPLIQKNN